MSGRLLSVLLFVALMSHRCTCVLAVDGKTYEIICAGLSLNNVTNAEAFPGVIWQAHRKITSFVCHDELRRKKIIDLIPPSKGASYWSSEYTDCNCAVTHQRMDECNTWWKWTTDYNCRSIVESAMCRVKQLFGGSLTMSDYDSQVV